ncbi:MAG TPA: glycosyltransferase family 2 protein [Rhodocyclaceae bacterium]|nr:glycosyltransferase family 2 protein [Rhodocyclaceae bacterium]HRQ47885.1 glycosyltransferase family 2 protein [Rhodocyclaceae bacterium]
MTPHPASSSAGAACDSESVLLSVIVPAFNEEDNIVPLAEEISAALASLHGRFEIILVDDASTDGTSRVLRELTIPNVRGVFHRLNCGQSAAIASGFQAARGDWVATLDGDGQNDPADLPAMLALALKEGIDCVTGVRAKRRDTLVRKVSSRVANAFRDWITGDRVTDSGCGVRVVRRSALREVPVFNGMHRFLPTLLRGQGYVVMEHMVNHRERLSGISKYGVHNRLWRGIRDCFGVRWYLKRAVRSDRLLEPDA